MTLAALASTGANVGAAQTDPAVSTSSIATTGNPAPEVPPRRPQSNAYLPDEQLSLEQQIAVLRARLDELEREVKQREAAGPNPTNDPANNEDAVALRAAAKKLVSGDTASSAPAPTAAGMPAAAERRQPTTPPDPSQANPHAPAFTDWDWTWLNGYPRNKDTAYDSKFFTPEVRADLTYTYDFNKPDDDSIGGSSEIFRSNEIQLEQMGVGGDFHLDHAHARLMTQFGMYSSTTPRNDPSYAKGQWTLDTSYRYLSEGYGGYQIPNVMHGINFDAGIFLSYIGLFSYYNFDNWAYQPSYVSSNTPWFFEGIRVQIFPSEHLKIEPWFINGWQSYASANSRKGLGGQIRWTPFPWMNVISNNYGLGHDDLYIPNRGRLHTDNSVEIKYYDRPAKTLDKMGFSFTGDLGCEFGGGVSCHGNTAGGPKQSFIGFMLYNRAWFNKDHHGLTIGGGAINNPGRYLVLLPPINGETAASAALNSPYFTENPGDQFKAWDSSVTYDYMPVEWLTWRFEYDYRHASVPYWSGHGGITPPPFLGAPYGTNNGFPTDYACMDGTPATELLSASQALCGPPGNPVHGGLWFPDLRRDENFVDIDLMVKF